MSNPSNILDNFRSYSYHHILIACENTGTAELLGQEADVDLFDNDGLEQTGRRTPRTVRDPARGLSGQYIVLFNGASDTDLFISSINWNTMVMPPSSDEGGFHTANTVGEMVIVEPRGVKFLATLRNAGEDLAVDPKTMILLLKTIFVGERFEGGTEIISTVEPLLFTIYDIGVEFSITGATYAVAFAAVADGISKLSEVSMVSDGFTLKFDTDEVENIEQAMNLLASKLNDRYDQFKAKLKASAVCAGVPLNIDEEFIPVTYKITVDDEFYREQPVGTNEKFLRSEFGNDYIEIADGTIGVERLIESVMKSSKEVIVGDNPELEPRFIRQQGEEGLAEAEGIDEQRRAREEQEKLNKQADEKEERIESNKEGLQKFMFKIHSTVESTSEEYIVHYNIKRYPVVSNIKNEVKQVMLYGPELGEGIEFDYIFTGKNTDILDLEMSMKMGMAFFHTLTTTENLPSASEVVGRGNAQASGTGGGEVNAIASVTGGEATPAKKPLFLGMSLRDVRQRNKVFPGETLAYNAALSRFAGYETINLEVTIRGNPQLLSESSPLPFRFRGNPDRDFTMRTIRTDAQVTGDTPPSTIMPRLWAQPGFAKINIRMPSGTSAEVNDAPGRENDFSEPFWYRGWYLIREVENRFDEGEFTQVLKLNALPTEDSNQSKLGTGDKECTQEQFEALVNQFTDEQDDTPATSVGQNRNFEEQRRRAAENHKKGNDTDRGSAENANVQRIGQTGVRR